MIAEGEPVPFCEVVKAVGGLVGAGSEFKSAELPLGAMTGEFDVYAVCPSPESCRAIYVVDTLSRVNQTEFINALATELEWRIRNRFSWQSNPADLPPANRTINVGKALPEEIIFTYLLLFLVLIILYYTGSSHHWLAILPLLLNCVSQAIYLTQLRYLNPPPVQLSSKKLQAWNWLTFVIYSWCMTIESMTTVWDVLRVAGLIVATGAVVKLIGRYFRRRAAKTIEERGEYYRSLVEHDEPRGWVSSPIECVACHYNMSGSRRAVCSECGTMNLHLLDRDDARALAESLGGALNNQLIVKKTEVQMA